MTDERLAAYLLLRRHLMSELEGSDFDPTDGEAVGRLVGDVVDRYEDDAREGHSGASPLRDPGEMRRRLAASVEGYGPLEALLADPGVEEIFLEGDRVTYVDGAGRLVVSDVPTSASEIRHVVARLLASTDRHLDVSSPIVQARVLDGEARLTAVIPPIADHLSATIRRFALRRETLDRLVELGSLSAEAASFLDVMMQVQSSFVVSGPPGAGKTSLLAAMLAAVPVTHCVRCVEEVRELHVPLSPTSSYSPCGRTASSWARSVVRRPSSSPVPPTQAAASAARSMPTRRGMRSKRSSMLRSWRART